MTFGSKGWATFYLRNSNSSSISVTLSKAYVDSNPAVYLGSVSLSTNNTVAPNGNLTLPIQFPGVTWQLWVKYQFILTDSLNFQHVWVQCFESC